MIIVGMLMVLVWVIVVLLSRSTTTFFHEMGHALPALLFTEGPVIVHIGSYGNISKSLKLNIRRLTIYFKLNLFDWNIGLCRHQSSGKLITELIIILGGPLMSIIVSIFLILYMIKNGATDAMASIFGVFILSAIWDFIVNIYPNKSPYQLHDGGTLYNDGYQLKRLLQEATLPDEYFEAMVKYNHGKYEEAALKMESVLKKGYKKREVYRKICNYLQRAGKQLEAEKYFEEYYDNFKFQTEDYANLGAFFLKRNEYEQALDCLEQALHKDYSNPQTVNDKGLALMGLGKIDLAILEFNSAILFDSNFAEAYRNRGFAKIKNNQLEGAFQDLQIAIKKEEGSAFNYLYLGKYYEKKWQYGEALAQYEKAREMHIDYHGIEFDISEMKRLLKQ